MNEYDVADWLDETLPNSERRSQREVAIWLGSQAAKIGRDGVCVDVGVWCGYTALAMALGGPMVLAVDTFTGSDVQTGRVALDQIQGGLQTTFHRFLDHVLAAPKPVRIVPLVGRSLDMAGALGLDSVDLVFLDGDHGLSSILGDLLAWSSVLKPGGLLCGHDFAQDHITRAVLLFITAYGWSPVETGLDQLWWTRKP